MLKTINHFSSTEFTNINYFLLVYYIHVQKKHIEIDGCNARNGEKNLNVYKYFCMALEILTKPSNIE